MGVSFLGHTTNYAIWVFNIDGKRFVARNFSTPTPLNIRFVGAFDDSPMGGTLVKTSGFDITESSPRIVVWTWGGKLYTSSWDINDEINDEQELYFSSPVPYSGPPVAPVGGGVTNTETPPPPPIQTPVPSLPIDQGGPIVSGPQLPPPAPAPTPSPRAPIPPPAITGPVQVPSVTPAGTDWVKLGLQLGAAYLLLS